MKVKKVSLLLSFLLLCLIFPLALQADNDDDEDEQKSGYNVYADKDETSWGKKGKADFGTVENALYQKECGACHLAFQPGLLPGRSWNKLLDGLSEHFDDDASLKKENLDQIRSFLLANSMEHSSSGTARKLLKSIGSRTVLRITDIPYLKQDHNEIPAGLIKQKSVRTISNCAACHTTAERGNYSERNIHIPK